MKTKIASKLILLFLLTYTVGLQAQSNTYEFHYLTESRLAKQDKDKAHKETGQFSINFTNYVALEEMTIYWDSEDIGERADFVMLSKRDTIISCRKYIVRTAKCKAFSDYKVTIFYPEIQQNNIKELHFLDKNVNTSYIFKY